MLVTLTVAIFQIGPPSNDILSMTPTNPSTIHCSEFVLKYYSYDYKYKWQI